MSPTSFDLPRKYTPVKANSDDISLHHYATPVIERYSYLSSELVQKNASSALNLISKVEPLMKKICFIV